MLFGTLIASVVGTTGAAMILIRPLLRANAARFHNVHIVVFFIFLVGNIGGALSPLGDPPLFIGFLNGVDFFWPAKEPLAADGVRRRLRACGFLSSSTCGFTSRTAAPSPVDDLSPREPVRLRGAVNLLLLALIIAAVIDSALWHPGITFKIYGTTLALQDAARDAVLVRCRSRCRCG